MIRKKPNIVVTGTPGVGKTSHCDLLAQQTGLKHLQINQIVKERDCYEGWDHELQSWIVDEDRVSWMIAPADDSTVSDLSVASRLS
jgi:adenylate kinase